MTLRGTWVSVKCPVERQKPKFGYGSMHYQWHSVEIVSGIWVHSLVHTGEAMPSIHGYGFLKRWANGHKATWLLGFTCLQRRRPIPVDRHRRLFEMRHDARRCIKVGICMGRMWPGQGRTGNMTVRIGPGLTCEVVEKRNNDN